MIKEEEQAVEVETLTTVSEENDFKYMLQDVSGMYLGARFSYQEILDHEMVPFKFKAIITQYLLKESTLDTTLESDFYYLQRGTFLYETFEQLKIKVKIYIQTEKKTLFGATKQVYTEKNVSLKELTEMNLAQKKGKGLIVREIIVSKLGLMTFSV